MTASIRRIIRCGNRDNILPICNAAYDPSVITSCYGYRSILSNADRDKASGGYRSDILPFGYIALAFFFIPFRYH